MSRIQLAPLNDLDVLVGPIKTVSSSGTKASVTTGTVAGLISTSKAATATAADVTLEANLSYVGGEDNGEGGTYDEGMWLFQLDAAVLTASLLSTNFASTVPYLIVKRDNAIRRAIRMEYVDSLAAEVEDAA